MFALVFAVISLTSVDPDAPTTTAPHIAASSASSALPFDVNLDSSDAVVVAQPCTYGEPRLGSRLFDDAGELARLLTTPVCADEAAWALQAFGPPLWLRRAGTADLMLTRPAVATPRQQPLLDLGRTPMLQAPPPIRAPVFATLPPHMRAGGVRAGAVHAEVHAQTLHR